MNSNDHSLQSNWSRRRDELGAAGRRENGWNKDSDGSAAGTYDEEEPLGYRGEHKASNFRSEYAPTHDTRQAAGSDQMGEDYPSPGPGNGRWHDDGDEGRGDWNDKRGQWDIDVIPSVAPQPQDYPEEKHTRESRRRGATRSPTDVRRKRRILGSWWLRAITIATCVLILFGLLGSGGIAFVRFQYTYQLAKSGLQHFKNAEADLTLVAAHPFDTTNVTRAHDEFAGAFQDFSQVSGSLAALPSGLTHAPVVGSKLGGATRLVPIATEAAQAGMIACDVMTTLMTKLKNPLTPSANGLTAADLGAISAQYGQLRAIFNDILAKIGTLQPSDLTLDPRLGPALATLRAKLPQIQQLMDYAQILLPLAPQLLGVTQPSNFLVEVLDSTELRPGGGFIGNYGLLTLTGGHLNGLHIQDVDLLDAPYKYGNLVIPLPAQYEWFAGTSPKWGFRDSNLEADFPTSAQYGESLYKQEGGTGELQGVIAITPWLIQNALRITGPISVPEFNETVSADNMVSLIHKYQLSALAGGPDNVSDPNSGTSLRKQFTGYLFQHFMETVKSQFVQDVGKLLKLANDSLHTKDIQVYVNTVAAESILRQHHVAGTIDAPQTGDSLLAVDANIVASKINYYLQYTLTDQVTLDASGTATHKTTLSYVWPADPSTLTNSFPAGYPYLYIAYLRFYVPPGAQMQSQTGWQTASAADYAFGRTVWGGTVYVSYASHTDVTVTWREPKAATLAGTTWQYTNLIQKQAGITVNLRYSLTLPNCGRLIGSPPGGSTMPRPDMLLLNEPLSTDVPFTVRYAC